MVIWCNSQSVTTNRITMKSHPSVINIRNHKPPVSFSCQLSCHNYKVELGRYKINNKSKFGNACLRAI
ncbi:hypothetical protein EUGRSUZ_E02273 [Eucalyptus grandis]|uniref:Uncharacterized protein n=2 Tax=Eucalyptus grandis TaxID=71139 RepID=A0ACC3KXG5_EUCGR|nr:hypothetical protein EUGRSUZ_E02273 [Eucalyptus grandis]